MTNSGYATSIELATVKEKRGGEKNHCIIIVEI